tara:strand:+ start:2841 stop:3626 length:786 start_codon:yes stop_codon:yes gene_type:complete
MKVDVCIAISTVGSKINNLLIPAERDGVTYLVIHQVDSIKDKVPWLENNIRSDLSYVCMADFGLSKSRNAVLSNCKSKYAYIMDDDVGFDLDKIQMLIKYMEEDKVDIATCQFCYHDGSSPKKYRKEAFFHNILSVAKVASIEICIKVSVLRKNNILFDEGFGLGTALPSGEEYIFLVDCLRAKLKVKYYPIVTGIHPNETSGLDFFTSTPKVLAKREMLKKIFGWKSAAYILVFWVKKVPIAYRAGYGLAFTKTMLLGIK